MFCTVIFHDMVILWWLCVCVCVLIQYIKYLTNMKCTVPHLVWYTFLLSHSICCHTTQLLLIMIGWHVSGYCSCDCHNDDNITQDTKNWSEAACWVALHHVVCVCVCVCVCVRVSRESACQQQDTDPGLNPELFYTASHLSKDLSALSVHSPDFQPEWMMGITAGLDRRWDVPQHVSSEPNDPPVTSQSIQVHCPFCCLS